MDRQENNHSGFSLVELLIIIGIISFLLSVIVPALGRARDQSNLIICRSRQRNLVMACLVYSGEHNSRLPLDKKIDNPHLELINMLSTGDYIDAMECYYCPSVSDEDSCLSPRNFESGNISYFYFSFTDRPANRYLSNFFLKSMPWPRILRDTMSPSSWVLSDSWFSNIPTAHRWYKKGVNYATLDGSVQMVKESPRQLFE
ncbi:MAG: type II secretion system protein [Sedimentisphaerales bacterium]|nr:type II secretion system protein [Sedimentisphaerales bacterium]